MRSYDLTLTNPAGQILALSTNGFAVSTSGRPTFSSRTPTQGGGTINDPGALNIEFDMPVSTYAMPQGLQSIRVLGVGIKQISQGALLNPNPPVGIPGAGFTLTGGMRPGLPLATAAYQDNQSGVLAQGSVYQAFGNWQGINQTLELVVQPATLAPQGGIQFKWLPGQMLWLAIYAALQPAFPGLTVNVAISPSLVQTTSSSSVNGGYKTLGDFAEMLVDQTQKIGTQVTNNPLYPGVQIAIAGNTINVYDNTAQSMPKQLKFQDLIGQPTWIEANAVNFKTVLRADIQLGDLITFPPGIVQPYVLTSPGAVSPGSPASDASTFKGTFLVQEVHHFGNFRQPDADSWATTFTAVATGTGGFAL